MKVITVTNVSEVDAEMYSVDFDEVYRDEEATLAALQSYDINGLIRTSIRGEKYLVDSGGFSSFRYMILLHSCCRLVLTVS